VIPPALSAPPLMASIHSGVAVRRCLALFFRLDVSNGKNLADKLPTNRSVINTKDDFIVKR